ncbi:F-box/WD repeat-containing protein 7-like [Liolophura sinensis]|uniref:F-box/WD repeat-containing protein 7-like n=1 Tax=Liolophura sinensis TaxID=3198878 RepID=UPI0031586448
MAYEAKMDFVHYLPHELTLKILFYLTPSELSKFSACCFAWREIANTDSLWLHHCMCHGWLHYGISGQILRETSLFPKETNVSGNSPVFYLWVPETTRLKPICKWKHIFLRMTHLSQNWAKGRYSVAPILRGHKEKVTAMDCNGRTLVSGSEDRSVCIWDVASCTCIHRLNVHSDTVTAIKLKRNLLVTGCADTAIRVFDVTKGEQLFTLQGHSDSVDRLILMGEDILVSQGADRTVRVWSLGMRKLKHLLRGHTDDIECIWEHGSHVITGSWDKSLIMWDVVKGHRLLTFTGHTEVISCCQFDDKKIVSGSADQTLRIWCPRTGQCLKELSGHTGEVYCLKYNDQVIVSGSSDSVIIIWSLAGHLCHTLHGHLGVVRCLHLTPHRLVSGGDQKKIIVWDYKEGKLLNVVHRQPTKLHLMWINDTKLITASPEKPGTVTILSYW